MKSGDTYKFTLSWPMVTEEQILAGEFIGKLGNKKSKFIVQLICDYITAHPETINPKETLKIIIESTSVGETMKEMIKSVIQTELADKMVLQQSTDNAIIEQADAEIDTGIDDMFENLDMWNNQ
jgi:hypothetical protein